MQTLLYSLLNISAKYNQNLSIPFRAIPFQNWAVFWDTVYVLCSSYCLDDVCICTLVL